MSSLRATHAFKVCFGLGFLLGFVVVLFVVCLINILYLLVEVGSLILVHGIGFSVE